jgi:hypothetical protein
VSCGGLATVLNPIHRRLLLFLLCSFAVWYRIVQGIEGNPGSGVHAVRRFDDGGDGDQAPAQPHRLARNTVQRRLLSEMQDRCADGSPSNRSPPARRAHSRFPQGHWKALATLAASGRETIRSLPFGCDDLGRFRFSGEAGGRQCGRMPPGHRRLSLVGLGTLPDTLAHDAAHRRLSSITDDLWFECRHMIHFLGWKII